MILTPLVFLMGQLRVRSASRAGLGFVKQSCALEAGIHLHGGGDAGGAIAAFAPARRGRFLGCGSVVLPLPFRSQLPALAVKPNGLQIIQPSGWPEPGGRGPTLGQRRHGQLP